MKMLFAGAIQGDIQDFQDKAKSVDAQWIVTPGDFGAWPDPRRMDRAAKKYCSDEFAKRYVGADPREIRTPVLFTAGVHEDHRFLAERYAADNTEVLSNVHYLANGYRTTIGFEIDQPPCRVTGLGRVYSENSYNGVYGPNSKRHYTRHQIERACSSGPTDLLLLYDHIDAPGLRNLIYATRPKLILNAAHTNRNPYDEVQKTPVITLGRRETRVVQWENGNFNI
jgi:hypothetical protein